MPAKVASKNIYLDDTSFSFLWNLSSTEMYMICGYVIPVQKEKELERDIVAVKAKYKITSQHPVKWNLKGLKEFYKNRDESGKLNYLIKNADELRMELLSVLTKKEYGVVLYSSSIIRLLNKYKPTTSYQRCFVNLLQRVAQNLEGVENPHGLFIDFIKEDSDTIADCYAKGVNEGVDLEGNRHYCGPFIKKGMSQNLYYGKTNHNQFLQLADMVTGCVRDFLEYCFADQGFERVIKFFPKLVRYFCWDEQAGSPMRRGIVIAPNTLYAYVQKGYSKVMDELAREFPN